MSVSCPPRVAEVIHAQYPMIDLVWNQEKSALEFVEAYSEEAVIKKRSIGVYKNPDGSSVPVSPDRVMDFLHRADTRKWPVMDRVNLWRKERDAAREARIDKAVEEAGNRVLEDYSRIAGIPTFFFGPSMEVSREHHHPTIQKMLRARGID